MTDTEIERLLRQPPEVPVPPWLHSQLRSQIALEPARDAYVTATPPWWRRWAPALSIALLMAACLVAIAVHTGKLHRIRAERRLLEQQLNDNRASLQTASAVPANHPEDAARHIEEAQRLRAEIEQLKQQLVEAQELAAQNESLRAQIAAAKANTTTEDPFAAQKAKAERIQCINNIKQIALAALMWAHDNGHVLPPDFQSMQRHLNSPKLLTCPSDAANLRMPKKVISETNGLVRTTADAEHAPKSWDNFDYGRVSYDWLAAGHRDDGPRDEVIVRCRIHPNAGYSDGSAHQWDPAAMEYVTEDGTIKLRRKTVPYLPYQ